MMIDYEAPILAALRGNSTIASLLGTDWRGIVKVYTEIVPENTETNEPVTAPYITFYEITNYDSDHADDRVISSEIHFQIDIFTQESPLLVRKEVDKEMKLLGFGRSGAASNYDQTTKTYHRVLRYRTKVYEL